MIRVFVHLNDTHFHPKNPVSRVDDFNEELFTILDQVAAIARHFQKTGNGAEVAICHAGDWFHRANRIPWPPLNRLLAWAMDLRKDGIAIYTIPGNHDLEHDRYESAATLPIGVLFESGLFINVARRTVSVLYGVPWPDGGRPSSEWPPIPPDVQVVLVHGFATPEGGTQYGQFCHRYEDLAAFAPHVQVWHFGHDHADHGVYTAANSAKFINLGATSRGVLDHETLNRQVKVAVSSIGADTLKWDVRQVALKLKPVAEVFDVALREKKQQEQAEIEAFVQQLAGHLSTMLTVDYKALLDGLNLDTAVRAAVDGYIERAESA